MKLLEKCKQDEAVLAEKKLSSPKLPSHSPAIVSSAPLATVTQSPALPTTAKTIAGDSRPAVSSAPVVSSPPAAKNPEARVKAEITQEHILKEIQTTLEERKKLQNYVSKYEKGIQDLENGSSPLHNVSGFTYGLFGPSSQSLMRN